MTYYEGTFGEMAHIVGQAKSKKSARGFGPLPVGHRDTAENLMLICDDEHDELDRFGPRDAFPIEVLQNLKKIHEDNVRRVTGLDRSKTTTPVRMIGRLRGESTEVDRKTAATAILAQMRIPRYDWGYHDTVEIDLRHVAGEADLDAGYYPAACAIIDQEIGGKLGDGMRSGEIEHLSVFAFARLPLLVYLGAKIGDNIPTDVYERHRNPETWLWPANGNTHDFSVRSPEADPAATEGVLIVNISGAIQRTELPEHLQALPLFELTVEGSTPQTGIIKHPETLAALDRAARLLFGQIENEGHKAIRRLHVFAAMPMSAAVTVGRVTNSATHPTLVMYDRTANGYVEALEVS